VPTDEDFENAIRACPPDGIRELLSNFYELVDGRVNGVSALLYACSIGRQDIAAAIALRRPALTLMEASALGALDAAALQLRDNPIALESAGPEGLRPLGVAALYGQESVARLLLERGADPSGAAHISPFATPLHTAAAANQPEIARLLIEKGALIDARQQGGYTPLMIACVQGRRAIVDLLLQAGADPGLTDDFNRSADDYARQWGFTLRPQSVTG
jgi:ankyrin repeat protein